MLLNGITFVFYSEMRNFEEERLQKEQLAQEKREKQKECESSLQELMIKSVKLHDEVQKERERVSRLWYTMLQIVIFCSKDIMSD